MTAQADRAAAKRNEALTALWNLQSGKPLEFRLKLGNHERWLPLDGGVFTLLALLNDERFEVRPKCNPAAYFICRTCELASNYDDEALGGSHIAKRHPGEPDDAPRRTCKGTLERVLMPQVQDPCETETP